MTPPPRGHEVAVRVVLIVSAVTAIAALVVAYELATTPTTVADARVEQVELIPAGEPIAGEADVFRTNSNVVSIPLSDTRHRAAHPRTMRTYRVLRAYPGAPPRIPHGFTADEFRTGACTTCHERGGYSPRFGAYVPLTPHPDMGACLQCHLGNDAVTGVALPSFDPNARCLQCHASGGARPIADATSLDASWPALAARAVNRPPPTIPHSLQWRTNCLTCHAGPSAVEELRMDHPERANCRQCHVAPQAESGAYVRPTRMEGHP